MKTTPDQLRALCSMIESIRREAGYKESISIPQPGKKYARLVATRDGCEYGGSAHAFVNLETGDILKPDGWKKPAAGDPRKPAQPGRRTLRFDPAGHPYGGAIISHR